MIGVVFRFGGEVIMVRIDGFNCYFKTSQSNLYSTIDGLKLNKSGVIKEHPDLKDKEEWRKIAIKRFKEKLKKMKSEKQRMEYVINDLTKFGYISLYYQRQGFRPIKITGGTK
jgi:hypothetical protein